jgi:hypothetical protein
VALLVTIRTGDRALPWWPYNQPLPASKRIRAGKENDFFRQCVGSRSVAFVNFFQLNINASLLTIWASPGVSRAAA